MKIEINSWWKNKLTGHKAVLDGSEKNKSFFWLTPVDGFSQEMDQVRLTKNQLLKSWELIP